MSRDLPKSPKAQLVKNETNYELTLNLEDKRGIRYWIVYYSYGNKELYEIKSVEDNIFRIPIIYQFESASDKTISDNSNNEKVLNYLGISVIDKFGNESKIVNLPLN